MGGIRAETIPQKLIALLIKNISICEIYICQCIFTGNFACEHTRLYQSVRTAVSSSGCQIQQVSVQPSCRLVWIPVLSPLSMLYRMYVLCCCFFYFTDIFQIRGLHKSHRRGRGSATKKFHKMLHFLGDGEGRPTRILKLHNKIFG